MFSHYATRLALNPDLELQRRLILSEFIQRCSEDKIVGRWLLSRVATVAVGTRPSRIRCGCGRRLLVFHIKECRLLLACFYW